MEKDILKSIANKIPKNTWICFITGVVFGVLNHMYILTHKLPMWDDMNSFYRNGMSKILARWMLDYVDWISGYWSVPWINGLITILFVSIGACFILAVLRLNTMTSAVLLPVMMVSFPSVASTLGFTFTADSYAFGIMMVCAATYFIRKGKYGFLPGIACMCMSLGCYQAYLPLAASILVLSYILDTFDEDKTYKTIFLSGIKSVISLAAALVIYINLANFLYPNMPDNNGVNEMGKIDLLELPGLIVEAYKNIIKYFVFRPMSFVNTQMHVANVIAVVLCVMGGVFLFIAAKLYKDKWKSLIFAVLACIYPLTMSAIYVMAPDAHVSMLMLYAYVMLYVALIAFCERLISDDKFQILEKIKARSVYAVAAILCIVTIAHSNFIIDNEAYFRSSIAYERVKDYFSRMMTRVEAMEGYEYGAPLFVWGEFAVLSEYNTNPLSVGFRIDDQKFADFSGIALEQGMMTSGSRNNFLRIYLGIDMPVLEDAQIEKIQKSVEFAQMPDYPAQGSIKQIDGVWVVKLVQDWETYQEEYLQSKEK